MPVNKENSLFPNKETMRKFCEKHYTSNPTVEKYTPSYDLSLHLL